MIARSVLTATRPRQWPKNLLVFAVPLASGDITEPDVILASCLAFIVFICASSAVYLCNDILDREADRRHPQKRQRPIASGDLSVPIATGVAALLSVFGLALAFLTSSQLGALVLTYLGLQAFYLTWAKHQAVLDMACIATGFVLRSVAGGVGADIPVSAWFLTVTAAISIMIVAGKRASELERDESGQSRAVLRDYSKPYLRFVWGAAAAASVVFYSLWAAELVSGGGGLWAHLSVIPFTLAIVYYAKRIDEGKAETPEDVLLGDRILQVVSVLWVVMFTIQAWL